MGFSSWFSKIIQMILIPATFKTQWSRCSSQTCQWLLEMSAELLPSLAQVCSFGNWTLPFHGHPRPYILIMQFKTTPATISGPSTSSARVVWLVWEWADFQHSLPMKLGMKANMEINSDRKTIIWGRNCSPALPLKWLLFLQVMTLFILFLIRWDLGRDKDICPGRQRHRSVSFKVAGYMHACGCLGACLCVWGQCG